MIRTTGYWKTWWANRKIDWGQSYGHGKDAVLHPHRNMVVQAFKKRPFGSVCEIGCAAGANLLRLAHAFPGIEVGGVDVSRDAIQTVLKYFPKGVFDVRSAEDLFFSEKSVDMVLSDAVLIYLDRRAVRNALREMKRIGRKGIVLVELHEPSWFKRLAIKWFSGYNAYDYRKLLKEIGFHDIELVKIPKETWPGKPWEDWGYVITANVK